MSQNVLVSNPADHTNRLGASRAAAVLGRDPRCSPVQAWLEIRGFEVERDPKLAEPAHWGTVLEDIVATEGYTRTTGRVLVPHEETLRHPDHEWLTCHLDRIVPGDPIIPYQGKCRSQYLRQDWGEEGTDDIPDPELIQVCTELEIARRVLHCEDFEDIGVLFGGNSFAWFRVEYHAALARELVERLVEWWRRHIVEGMEPEPMSEADCRALWRKCATLTREAMPEDLDVIRELVEIAEAEDALKKRRDAARLAARKMMGRAEEITAEIRANGKPPKRKALIRWPQTWDVDTAKLMEEQAEAAAKHRTILDVEALAEGDPETFAALLERFGKVDATAFRRAEPKLWARYRVVRDRGQMRLAAAAKEAVAQEASEA